MVTTRSMEKKKMQKAASPSGTPATPTTAMEVSENPTRRQLFVPNTGYEDEQTARRIVDQAVEMNTLEDLENIYMPGSTVHRRLQEVKRLLGIVAPSPRSRAIFPILPSPLEASPRTTPGGRSKNKKKPQQVIQPRSGMRSFLASLDESVDPEYSDPEALNYRINFGRKKDELVKRLYELYNQKVFDNKLDVDITWSKRLRNTAGRCITKKR